MFRDPIVQFTARGPISYHDPNAIEGPTGRGQDDISWKWVWDKEQEVWTRQEIVRRVYTQKTNKKGVHGTGFHPNVVTLPYVPEPWNMDKEPARYMYAKIMMQRKLLLRVIIFGSKKYRYAALYSTSWRRMCGCAKSSKTVLQ